MKVPILLQHYIHELLRPAIVAQMAHKCSLSKESRIELYYGFRV